MKEFSFVKACLIILVFAFGFSNYSFETGIIKYKEKQRNQCFVCLKWVFIRFGFVFLLILVFKLFFLFLTSQNTSTIV